MSVLQHIINVLIIMTWTMVIINLQRHVLFKNRASSGYLQTVKYINKTVYYFIQPLIWLQQSDFPCKIFWIHTFNIYIKRNLKNFWISSYVSIFEFCIQYVLYILNCVLCFVQYNVVKRLCELDSTVFLFPLYAVVNFITPEFICIHT